MASLRGRPASAKLVVVARYVPQHRMKRRVAARRAGVHAAAIFVGGAVLLSGAYGSGPVLLSAAPLTASVDVGSPTVGRNVDTSSSDSATAAATAATPASEIPVAVGRESRIDPAFVDIEAIGAVSTIERLGTLLDGRLETPNDFMKVGWWSGGVVPGEKGPAVLAGHLDSVAGPAIFARLSQLKPDDLIRIARKDGVVVTFAVTRVDRYPKDRFPAVSVYGPTDQAELRLITCGGSFDRQARSYNDNTVVYARLVPNTTSV